MKKQFTFFTFQVKYFIAFLLLFLIEFFIAKYFTDTIVRPFIGDVLVVILIYCFLNTFINFDRKKIAFGVMIFACVIEVLQAFHFVNLLGLGQNSIASIVLGSTFDWKDIMAYVIGFVICLKL